MATITVSTTTQSFGQLTSDLNLFSSYASSTVPPTTTLYNSEYSSASAYNTFFSNFDYDLGGPGVYYNFASSSVGEVVAPGYTMTVYGRTSAGGSNITEESLTNSLGQTVKAYGNFVYSGDPLESTLEIGSVISQVVYTTPDPTNSANSDFSAFDMAAYFNGYSYNGIVTSLGSGLIDTASGESVGVTLLTAQSIGIAPYDLSLSDGSVSGIAIGVTNSEGIQTDSMALNGVNLDLATTEVGNYFQQAFAGPDVVSISGGGSLNVINSLVVENNPTAAIVLYDSAANVSTNLDLLQILASENELDSVTLTDPGIAILNVTPTQEISDARALHAIITPFANSIVVSGINQTTDISGFANLIYLYGTDNITQSGGITTVVESSNSVVTMNASGGSQVIYANAAGGNVINAGPLTEFVGAPGAPGSTFNSSAGGADTVFAGSAIQYNGIAASSTFLLGGTGFANVVAGSSATLFGGSGGGNYAVGSGGAFFWNIGGGATDSILSGVASGVVTAFGSNSENIVVSQIGTGHGGTYVAFGQNDTINASAASGGNTFYVVDQTVPGGADFSGNTTLVGSSAGHDLFALFEFGSTSAHTVTIENWQASDTMYMNGFSAADSAAANAALESGHDGSVLFTLSDNTTIDFVGASPAAHS